MSERTANPPTASDSLVCSFGVGRKATGAVRATFADANELAALFEHEDNIGYERWWSPHVWTGDHRRQAHWASASAIVLDVDFNRDGKHVAPPPELRETPIRVGESLGATAHHLTPRGARLIWILREPTSDKDAWRQAAGAIGDRIDGLLADSGFSVDRSALLDTARIFWTPRAMVDEVERMASLQVVGNAVDLADLLPDQRQNGATADVRAAVDAYRTANPLALPRSGGTCPSCGHHGCFGSLPVDPQRWYCWSDRHEADSGGVGVRSARGWFGDVLDLHAHQHGCSRIDLLKRSGFLQDRQGSSAAQSGASEGHRQHQGKKAAPKNAPKSDDPRKPILLAFTEFHEQLEFALQHLALCDDLACDAGRIVQVVRDDRGDVLRMVPLSHGAIRERLSRLALWLGGTAEDPSVCNPPEDVVHALAETRHAWDGIVDIAADDEATARDWTEVLEDPPLEYLVGGAIPRAASVGLVGMPNQGKSAAALDIAMRLLHGMPTWLGRQLPGGGASTLYLAAEGAGGLGARLRAWVAAHPEERPAEGRYLAIRQVVPNLGAPDAAAQLHEIIAEVARQHDGVAPDLLVVDTLSAATPGVDEADAGAASAVGAALAAARRRYGCATMALHHFRKLGLAGAANDTRLPTLDDVRGSSVLVGSADVILAAHDHRIVSLKVRDGITPAPETYVITSFPTGRSDKAGCSETGPVVLPAVAAIAAAPEDHAEAERQRLVNKLDEMEDRAVEALRRLGEAPNSSTVVAEMTGKREQKFAAFNRAVAKGRIRDVGTSKSPRFVVVDADDTSSPQEGEGRERSKERPGTRDRSSPAPASCGSRGLQGTDGNLREPGTERAPAEDDGQSEKPKGKRKSMRPKKASAAVTPERVKPGDADFEYGRGEAQP